jgi:hypothetical protein
MKGKFVDILLFLGYVLIGVDIIITSSKNLVKQYSTIYDYYYKNETYEIGLFCYAPAQTEAKNDAKTAAVAAIRPFVNQYLWKVTDSSALPI